MGDLESEVVDYWGAENLQRWPEEVVAKTVLTDRSKAFLSQVGLPFPKEMSGFAPGNQWNLGLPPEGGGSGRRILAGPHEPTYLIDERQGGRVLRGLFTGRPHMGLEGFPESFLNSSIELFALSLTERAKAVNGVWPYVETQKSSKSVEEEIEKWLANLDLFAERVGAVDPPAMISEEAHWNYWVRYERFYVS